MKIPTFKNWKKYTFEFLSIFIAVSSAFALNNWNDNRRDRNAERKILEEIYNGLEKDLDDRGRYEVTGKTSDLYKFRTPPLRNIALTAPYFHNGAMTTLEEVVEHYDDIKKSLDNYTLASVNLGPYNQTIVVDDNEMRNKFRFNLISIGEVRRGLKLTDEEKKNLLEFLRTGILDYRFQKDRL